MTFYGNYGAVVEGTNDGCTRRPDLEHYERRPIDKEKPVLDLDTYEVHPNAVMASYNTSFSVDHILYECTVAHDKFCYLEDWSAGRIAEKKGDIHVMFGPRTRFTVNSEALGTLLVNKGLSASKLAVQLGLSRTTVTDMLYHQFATFKTLMKIRTRLTKEEFESILSKATHDRLSMLA
jgi:hypothetical protein